MEAICRFEGPYRFLSNFWPVLVEDATYVYPTVEHAYQAAKTTSDAHRVLIRDAPTPGVAKRLARSLSLRPDWKDIRLDVMYDLVQQKFEWPDLRQQLLDTGNAWLIEGNTWNDTFWGVCHGVGDNHLGLILMRVRREIREQRDATHVEAR
jgi:ribA/ribD-fused uncharacterized protein